MPRRATLGACLATLLIVVAAIFIRATPAAQAQPGSSTILGTDDDVTIRAFLVQVEDAVRTANVDGFAALVGPLGSRADALTFAAAELRSGATRVAIQERDRQEVTFPGIPGTGYSLTLDAFIEYGNQARVVTWQFFVRRSGDGWGLVREQVVSSVESLFRLALDGTREFDARRLVITSEDLQLTIEEGTAFAVHTDRGLTGLVVTGRGNMRFFPAPETEKGQVRIFAGSDVLETRFDAAYVRVGTPEIHFDATQLIGRQVDPRDLTRAQQIFREESPKSFAVDLADLTRDAWTLLPGADDFLAEVRTRRFDTLTYARSSSEPEDISVFERRRRRNIALYASKARLTSRGRFYNEDDLAPFDVLDYDIDITSEPERSWLEGRATMRLKVKAPDLGQLTIHLADSLVVHSVISDRFGRLFNLRVTNQNTILVNLPATLLRDSELQLTITYGGRLPPQPPDRETIGVGQFNLDDNGPHFVDPGSTPKAEPSYLYSNRSYWYPQSMVTDYATARIRVTVPADYTCIASGDPGGTPELIVGRTAANTQRAYVFTASRPARYLSFMVSRLVETDRRTVTFESGARAAAADATATLNLMVYANPRQTGRGKPTGARAAEMMQFYNSIVGDAPYPSFTIALVEDLIPGGHSPPYFARLNEPLLNSPLTWRNDPAAFENYPEFFMAHEIAHQWWGHAVGWQSYHEQWLSEGFSQYFAALYAGRSRGDDVFQGVLRRMRRWAIDESPQGPVYLGYRVGHIKNDGRAFRAIVYNKGAMVLHMLRQMVGDDVFFRGLRRFYTDSRFRKASTEEFRACMEAESGRDLSRFFERWIYGSGLPQVSFTYRVDPVTATITLHFEQTGDIYDIPALVTLEYADGRTDDLLVPVATRVVDVARPLAGVLRTAAISKRDVGLAEYH